MKLFYFPHSKYDAWCSECRAQIPKTEGRWRDTVTKYTLCSGCHSYLLEDDDVQPSVVTPTVIEDSKKTSTSLVVNEASTSGTVTPSSSCEATPRQASRGVEIEEGGENEAMRTKLDVDRYVEVVVNAFVRTRARLRETTLTKAEMPKNEVIASLAATAAIQYFRGQH